jgi:hypothetical protein
MPLDARNAAGSRVDLSHEAGETRSGLLLLKQDVDGQYVAQLFKWIKQHLRIKAFLGTSENAVKTQIWIAISTYVLIAIIKKRLHLPLSLYEILQILSLTMFEKTPLNQLLTNSPANDVDENQPQQLLLL